MNLIYIVLQKESLDVINGERLLVPTFLNSCDHPEDIFELPFGYETYIRNYPKFERPEGYSMIDCLKATLFDFSYYRKSVVFGRYFIRETVKLFEVLQ